MNYNKAANWPTFKSINRHCHRMSPGLPTRTSSPSRAPRIDEHSLSKSSILTLPPMPTARNGNPTQFDSDPSMRFTALGYDYGPSQGQLELTSDHYRHQQHQEEGNQQHALVLVWHERWWNRNLDTAFTPTTIRLLTQPPLFLLLGCAVAVGIGGSGGRGGRGGRKHVAATGSASFAVPMRKGQLNASLRLMTFSKLGLGRCVSCAASACAILAERLTTRPH